MIKTGNQAFWKAQVLGWGLIAGSNLTAQAMAGLPLKLLLSNAILPFIVGFLLTTVYRFLIRDLPWRRWRFRQVFLLLIVSTFLLTGLFMGLILLSIYVLFPQAGLMSLPAFFSNFTIFFLVLGLWNLIYFWIHYFNNWNRAEIEKWQLAAEMKDAQLGSLKAQINPHFVFNALNNIRALILEDPDRARDMLLNFSDLFRYSLTHTDQLKVELEEEIDIVNQYLELASIQYEDKLRYQLDIEEGLQSIQIPPMVLQLLVENAIKHGISQKKEGGAVSIHIHQQASFLDIIVKNSGRLLNSAQLGEKLGVGLENIRKRLDLIYNGKASLEVKEEQEFVVALIKIPL
ncbi:MAG: histidine kinase [Bacteroidota bacterium]